jgi:uncharacterized protein involved in type VI secretion and phage assembly
MSEARRFFGKYRGTVVNNVDVMQMGRIQALVPDVSGVMLTSWCMPCIPVAGIQTGVFTVPPIGAGVWVEFEQGDPDYPIWTGCFWEGQLGCLRWRAWYRPRYSASRCRPLQNGIVVSDFARQHHAKGDRRHNHRQQHRYLHTERRRSS